MKITCNFNTTISQGYNRKTVGVQTCPANYTKPEVATATYPAVYFTGKFNLQRLTPKNVNLGKEKEKLVRKIDNILQNEPNEMTKDELALYFQMQASEQVLKLQRRLEKLETEMALLITFGPKNRGAVEHARKIRKEYLKAERELANPSKIKPPKINKNPDLETDFVLLNKLKSAVTDDNYNLSGVYKSYYSGLEEIQTLRDLRQRYPKIKVPKNPKEVVSKKIEGTFTRKFYEDLDNLMEQGDYEGARKFVTQSVQDVLDGQLKRSTPEIRNEISRKIIPMTVTRVKRNYYNLKETNSISSIPLARKIKQPLLTDNDKKLLTVNYNDFILHVLKEQYLKNKKTNEIVYTYSKGRKGHSKEYKLAVSDLRDSEYKFQKPQENIKSIVSAGEELKFIQRNYDHFSKEELAKRLEFHADRQELNERYLDTLIKFSTCRFEPEDIDMMKKFLRESDAVMDGEKKLDDVVKYVSDNNISPKGTERIDEMERQNQLNIIKEEQKQHAKLNHLQDSFDEYINILYLNDLTRIADKCAEFRPTALDEASNKDAQEIFKIINKHLNPDNKLEILNKDRMKLELTRWQKYSEYYKSTEPSDIELLKKAEKYAKLPDGTIDADKAGKYLLNAETVKAYPSSFEYARDREAAEAIYKEFENDNDKRIEYYCKYDEYLDMSDTEKSSILNILKVFNKKDTFDKKMLKPIIEKIYLKSSTSAVASMDEKGSKQIKATIAPDAKSEIYDYYHFPKCLDYFENFEYALPQFATKFGRQGIKKLDNNFYELKIMGKTDRLLARNNEYIFNEFDPSGLH